MLRNTFTDCEGVFVLTELIVSRTRFVLNIFCAHIRTSSETLFSLLGFPAQPLIQGCNNSASTSLGFIRPEIDKKLAL